MTIIIPKAEYTALAEIINKEYTDGLDRILSAQENDDGSITCIGQDGTKQIECQITDDRIQFSLYNPESAANQTAQMAAPEKNAPDFVDSAVDRLGKLDPFKPWLERSKELLMQSASLDDYAAKLDNLYPQLPSGDFKELMLSAMTSASMAGYFEAESEMGEDAEFAKIPEGTTRRINGVNYVLRGSRWHKAENQGEEAPKDSKLERTMAIYDLVDKFEADLQGAPDTHEAAGDELIRNLMGLNSRDEAEARAAKIDMSGLGGQMRSQALRDAADFHQLIGKDLGIKTIRLEEDRSYANDIDMSIGLEDTSARTRREVLFHEMGHHGEFADPDSEKIASDWVKERATGAPESLRSLTGLDYDEDEIALPDNFFHPYVGKEYPQGCTEVHSMGLEMFSSGRNVVKLFKKDREHFDLTIRYIRQ